MKISGYQSRLTSAVDRMLHVLKPTRVLLQVERVRWLVFCLAAPCLLAMSVAPFARASEHENCHQDGGAELIVYWNNVLLQTLRVAHPAPTTASRSSAMVHAALFDAVNAFDRKYEPYAERLTPPRGASQQAAADAAAYTVLIYLNPSQSSFINQAYSQVLNQIPASAAKTSGIAFGKVVGEKIIALRVNDGSDVNFPYPGSDVPGVWRPTPPNFSPAVTPQWGYVKPFVIRSVAPFMPPPPPPLTSETYARSFNTVKELGRVDSTVRTPFQTQTAIFWSYDLPPRGTPIVIYNQAIQVLVQQQHNNLVDSARLFALGNFAMADIGIVTWRAKYIYDFWRPVTAIQLANEDNNSRTVADPAWLPFGAAMNGGPSTITPAFPSYTSGHSGFGAATFRIMEEFYGKDNIAFTLHSDELPGITHSFRSFDAAAEENGISRIYLGVHYLFDNTNGISAGRKVAEYTFTHALAPICSHER